MWERHRHTYVGSIPGHTINDLKTIEKKLCPSDPAAALLEVLDHEQNHSFTNHSLNVGFNLSQVILITIANTTATTPPVPGYTQEKIDCQQAIDPKATGTTWAESSADSDLSGYSSSYLHQVYQRGRGENILEDTKSESINDSSYLALPPETPILIDFYAPKDIFGLQIYKMGI
uniref:Uncharacterized protein n=1 Tax=Parascaris equorum TaxID=6256 RepID=A0A914S6V0_PAREQ